MVLHYSCAKDEKVKSPTGKQLAVGRVKAHRLCDSPGIRPTPAPRRAESEAVTCPSMCGGLCRPNQSSLFPPLLFICIQIRPDIPNLELPIEGNFALPFLAGFSSPSPSGGDAPPVGRVALRGGPASQ